METRSASSETFVAWIAEWLGRELKIAPEDIVPGKTFVRYGMDSVHAMMLVGDLEEHVGRRLPPTLAWDQPTVEAMAAHLAAEHAGVAAAGNADGDEDLLSRLDEMSEEEIDRLLAREQGR